MTPHAYHRLPATDKRSLCRHCLKPWDDPLHNEGLAPPKSTCVRCGKEIELSRTFNLDAIGPRWYSRVEDRGFELANPECDGTGLLHIPHPLTAANAANELAHIRDSLSE